jgi:hypothetical protein
MVGQLQIRALGIPEERWVVVGVTFYLFGEAR